MDRNIGGTSLPSLSGVTLNGSNYSSGWGKSYNYNDSSLKATVVSLETFDCTPYKYKGRDIYTKKADIAPKPASAMRIVSGIINDPIKNFFKDVSSIKDHAITSSGVGVFTTGVATFVTEIIATAMDGKPMDWKKIGGKTVGKASAGVVNFVGSLISLKKEGTKLKWREKSADKFVYNLIYNEKAICKDLWEHGSTMAVYRDTLTSAGLSPADTLKPKQWVELFKKPSLRKEFISARRAMYSSMLEDMFKGGLVDALKNIGLQMGAMVAFDYGFSLIGNFLSNWWFQGKSFAEAWSMENMHYGQELLKSVNKTVWTMVGRFIGYSIGNPKVGQIVGALIGTVINNWICEPFRLPNGDIDETACAIAAGAELAGAVVAGIIAACAASGPVGWVIGLAILAGATLAYLVTAAIYNWDKICNWVAERVEVVGQWFTSLGASISSGWQSFTNWAMSIGIAAGIAINNAVVAVRDWASNVWNDVKAAVVNGVTTAVVAVENFFVDLGDGIVWLWDQLTGWIPYVFG